MTKDEQREFIETLCDSNKQYMLSKLDKLPESWDGRELRWMFSEYAATAVWADMRNKRTKRYRDYVNTKMTKGI